MCCMYRWLYKSSTAGCTTSGAVKDDLGTLVERAHFLQDLMELEWSLSCLSFAHMSSQSLDFLWDLICSELCELNSLAWEVDFLLLLGLVSFPH